MLKTKFKLIIYLLIILLLFSSLSFASNEAVEGDPETTSAPIGNEIEGVDGEGEATDTTSEEPEVTRRDLYEKSVNDYVFNDILDGNAFISAKDFTLDSKEYRGLINGDLFVSASNVRFTSKYDFSDTKDLYGNPSYVFEEQAVISGDAFIVANKVVLDPGSIIRGNLFIIANEVEIGEQSNIYGNLYVTANKLTFNGFTNDLYASVKDFTSNYYYTYIYRDMHLLAENASINGVVRRNAFISADNLSTREHFKIETGGSAEVISSKFIFLGEIAGNLKVNSKEFYAVTQNNMEEYREVLEKSGDYSELLKNKDLLANPGDLDEEALAQLNEKLNFKTAVQGNIEYTSENELNLTDIVTGEKTFHKYSTTVPVLKIILSYVINLCALLLYVLVIYMIIKKFTPNCLEKISTKLNIKSLLISLGIGLALVIVVPLLFVLLAFIEIGVYLGFLVILLYFLLLAVSVPTVLIMISKILANIIGNKLGKLSEYICIAVVTFVFSLLLLIPYFNAILIILFILIGTGNLVTSHFRKEKIEA